ncbi:hypothetical protein HGP28_03955 [Vibrio sp. SM6]|uniref:Uncharacterized protein n=1 Tax=Vibrio agarilyticus TaxID=2726741 RepID=A0A7X8TP60_9VIBR|nr:hypothetical protein [Vibrio agarilyticus]NLS12046.1 hypothetical protein [Vibrio agarilyticus]
MISVHRDYVLADTSLMHIHIEVNPTGKLDLKVCETQVHHVTEFDNIRFDVGQNKTVLLGTDHSNPWQYTLSSKDAVELNHLIAEASEQLEILLRDLV